MTKTNNRNRILLALTALFFLSLSCNLPMLSVGRNSGGTLEENLRASGLVFVDSVEISEDLVKISYQILPDDTPELITSGWLNALLAAYEAESSAETYQLITSLNGEPYLEITANQIDLVGFFDEDLSPEEFLERLEITDVRPVDTRAYGLILPLGLDLDRIELDDSTLRVTYWPAPTADEAEVLAEWWEIFQALAELAEDVSVVEIENLYVDSSVITVRLNTSDLLAVINAEMDDLEYLASLEVESELVELIEETEEE